MHILLMYIQYVHTYMHIYMHIICMRIYVHTCILFYSLHTHVHSNHLESVVEEPEDAGEPEHRSSEFTGLYSTVQTKLHSLPAAAGADSCEENLEEKTEAVEGEETVEEASEEEDSGNDPSEQTSWVQWEDFANTFK